MVEAHLKSRFSSLTGVFSVDEAAAESVRS
jgi:hypothetical protein